MAEKTVVMVVEREDKAAACPRTDVRAALLTPARLMLGAVA